MEIVLHDNYSLCGTNTLIDALVQTMKLVKNKNYYEAKFKGKDHWTFIQTQNSNHSIICILTNPQNKLVSSGESRNVYTSLLINAEGQKIFDITVDKHNRDPIDILLKQCSCLQYVQNPLFKELIPDIEKLHSHKPANMKIGVLRIKSKQTKIKEWMRNKSSSRFEAFVDMLGQMTPMNNWNGFKGDLHDDQKGIYNHWKGEIPIIYHIAPMLSSDEIRRLIGNDTLIILYVDDVKQVSVNDIRLNLKKINQFGNVTQCFAIVWKFKDQYLLRFVVGKTMKDKGPKSVLQPVKFKIFEDILLNKFYTVMCKLHKNESFKKLYSLPRQDYINDLVDKLQLKNKRIKKSSSLFDSSSGSSFMKHSDIKK